MIDIPVDVIGRETLSRVFGQDNRTLLAFEALAKVARSRVWQRQRKQPRPRRKRRL
jgi:hypothetical protein